MRHRAHPWHFASLSKCLHLLTDKHIHSGIHSYGQFRVSTSPQLKHGSGKNPHRCPSWRGCFHTRDVLVERRWGCETLKTKSTSLSHENVGEQKCMCHSWLFKESFPSPLWELGSLQSLDFEMAKESPLSKVEGYWNNSGEYELLSTEVRCWLKADVCFWFSVIWFFCHHGKRCIMFKLKYPSSAKSVCCIWNISNCSSSDQLLQILLCVMSDSVCAKKKWKLKIVFDIPRATRCPLQKAILTH